jgi:pimeloyl-ACP methyl ester carboxylesterase
MGRQGLSPRAIAMYRFPAKSKASAAGELIEYVVAGRGDFAVVLVNGSGGPIEGWHKVFEPIAGFAKVLAYNRPGVGGSSDPQHPQTGSHMVESLRAVLKHAKLPPPYVLVGHSFGGLIANLFARLHPAEVAAAVLVEATSVKDVATFARHENAMQRVARRLLDKFFPPNPHSETQHVQAIVAELEAAAAFPPIPLTVVSGGKPAMAWATASSALVARAEHQQELAGLSPLGKRIIAARSGHFPQFTEPELVVAAIREAAHEPLGRAP